MPVLDPSDVEPTTPGADLRKVASPPALFGKGKILGPEAVEKKPVVVGAEPDVQAGLKSLLAPTGAAVGTEAALTALGMPEVGIPAMLLRSAVSGVINAAAMKALPPEYGGDPSSSILSDFLWGAAPEALSATAQGMLRRIPEKSLKRASQQWLKEGTKEILDPENLTVQRNLLAPLKTPGAVPFPQILQPGRQLTDQANQARQPLLDVIRGARNAVGAPIGAAYDAVKDVTKPVDTSGFENFVNGLRQDQIAPSPAAEKYLGRLRSMDPEVQRQAFEAAAKPPDPNTFPLTNAAPGFSPDDQATLDATAQRLGYKNFADATRGGPNAQATIQGLAGVKPTAAPTISSAGAIQLGANEFVPKDTTFDELRNMRQQVNKDLQRAKGGDVYALGRIQDKLDDQLMEHLPDNMKDLRSNYREFIHRWGYEREHRLFKAGDPNEIVKEVFSKPRDGFELASEAANDPQKLQSVRSSFRQYVWGGQDVKGLGTSAKRADAVRKKLAPYVENGDPATLKLLLGDKPGETMSNMVSWAAYAPDLRQHLEKSKQFRDAFDRSFRHYFLRQGMDPDQSMGQALQNTMGMLGSPEAVGGPQQVIGGTPYLPGLSASHSGSNIWGMRHLGEAGMAAALARPGAALYQASAGAMMLFHGGGFEASSKMGATRFLVNAFKSNSPLKAGWWFARGLDTMAHGAAQGMRDKSPPDEEDGE